MAQRYKLRLGDGTVVSVDADGLEGWADDRRALAQAVGTQQWRPLSEVLAEEQAAARLAQALVPPKPRPESPSPPPPLELSDLGLEVPAVEPRPTPRPSLQALADDPMSRSAEDPLAALATDDMPVIPLKPLADEPVFRSAWSGSQDEDETAEDEPRHDRLDGPLLTVLETLGGFLSRCLDRLTPLAAKLAPGSRERPVSRRVDTTAVARGVEQEDAAEQPSFYERAGAWMRGLGARLRRPAGAETPPPKHEPAPPTTLREPAPARRPLAAPTPLSELPVLPFAPSREPRERADVYTGPEPTRFGFPDLEPLWRWTKRILAIGALAAALAYAVLERDTWLPKTAELGQAVFTQIDRQVLSRERNAELQRALSDAARQLPELAPQTIELVFARSPTSAADPGEVFQLAREAADRGRATLTRAEGEELASLEGELLGGLSRAERGLVRDYDRARARRPVFPFENPQVMELVARGARSLPPERLERLQALTHQAVAAGLARPEGAGAPSTPR